jgi:hypothetical protein
MGNILEDASCFQIAPFKLDSKYDSVVMFVDIPNLKSLQIGGGCFVNSSVFIQGNVLRRAI